MEPVDLVVAIVKLMKELGIPAVIADIVTIVIGKNDCLQ
jgi:hypothetical protein